MGFVFISSSLLSDWLSRCRSILSVCWCVALTWMFTWCLLNR